MTTRVLHQQPPPDAESEWTPPEGFRIEWVESDGARVATDEEKATRHCRRIGCRRSPVMALARTRHNKNGGYSSNWWLYCDWHTYGRRVDGDVVLHRRAVREDT